MKRNVITELDGAKPTKAENISLPLLSIKTWSNISTSPYLETYLTAKILRLVSEVQNIVMSVNLY